jgi:ABC-type transport system involved in multi-copper enzyme maturation permease subunit
MAGQPGEKSDPAGAVPLVFRAPVFGRELVWQLRQRRTYALQLAFLGAIFAVLLVVWPHDERDAAASGRAAFAVLAGMELAAAALTAAATAAPAIAGERAKETLGLLTLAGAAPLRIVAGKALGRFAQVLLHIAITLPLVGALFTIGGLSLREVGTIFLGAAALAALGAGLGTLASAWFRRGDGATIAALVALLAIAVLPLVPIALGARFPAHHVSPYAWYLAVFSPLSWTGEVVFRDFWVAPLLHAALGIAAIVAGGAVLARTGPLPFRGGERPPLRRLLLRLRKRGGPLGLTSRFGTEVAALRWRERSVRAISDGALAAVLVAGLAAFEVWVPPAARPALRKGTAIGLGALATLLATVLGASAVSRERDQETLEPLAAAPLEAEQFLLGKLLGLGRAVLVAAAALIVHVTAGAARGDLPGVAAFAIALTVPFGLVLHAVMGLSFSSHAASTVRAVAASLGAAVALAGVAPYLTCFSYGLSPVRFVAIVLDAGPSVGSRTPGPEEWIAVAVTTAACTIAFAVVAWNHLRARFDALIGRAALDLIELPDRISGPSDEV